MNCDNTLWRITIDTNPEDCNYHCIMCEEHSRFSHYKESLGCHRRMPVEWIDQLFEEARQLGVKEIIPSTMGEPLLYKGIDRFYDLSQKTGIKINLTTNGSFPGKTIDEWARIIIPNTTDVKISINGATKETSEKVMEGSNFDKEIYNVKHLVKYRNEYFKKSGYYCRITLQLTFMSINMHELADIVKMAAELDVDRIKGHHLWTHFPEIEHFSMKDTPENISLWNQYVSDAQTAQKQYLRPNGKEVLLENITPLSIEKGKTVPEESECPFLGRELWVSATGVISPCCAPDQLRKTLGDFGNIQKTSLTEMMASDTYQDLLANYKTRTLCKTCNMRR